MISKLISVALITLIYGNIAEAAIKPADRQKMAKVEGLNPDSPLHFGWYSAAKKEKEENNRQWYVARGYLQPIGAAMAGPAAAAAPAPIILGGAPINYDDMDSLNHAATLILHFHRLPGGPLYQRAVVHLLSVHRAVPSKESIRQEYKEYLTPFSRQMENIEENIQTFSLDDIGRMIDEALRVVAPEALNPRTSKQSVDTLAVFSLIRSTQNTLKRMIGTQPTIETLNSSSYKKLSFFNQTLLTSPIMQAAGEVESPHTKEIYIVAKEIEQLELRVYYLNITQNFERKLQSFPYSVIRLLKPQNKRGLTKAEQLLAAIKQNQELIRNTFNPQLLKLLPPSHASALLYLLTTSPAVKRALDAGNVGLDAGQALPPAVYTFIDALKTRRTEPPRSRIRGTLDQRGVLERLVERILTTYNLLEQHAHNPRPLQPPVPQAQADAGLFAGAAAQDNPFKKMAKVRRGGGAGAPPPPPPPPGFGGGAGAAALPPPPPPPGGLGGGAAAAGAPASQDHLQAIRQGKGLKKTGRPLT